MLVECANSTDLRQVQRLTVASAIAQHQVASSSFNADRNQRRF